MVTGSGNRSKQNKAAETNPRLSDPVGERANSCSVDLDHQYHSLIEQISGLLFSTFTITLYSFARNIPGDCRRRSVKGSGSSKVSGHESLKIGRL